MSIDAQTASAIAAAISAFAALVSLSGPPPRSADSTAGTCGVPRKAASKLDHLFETGS